MLPKGTDKLPDPIELQVGTTVGTYTDPRRNPAIATRDAFAEYYANTRFRPGAKGRGVLPAATATIGDTIGIGFFVYEWFFVLLFCSSFISFV